MATGASRFTTAARQPRVLFSETDATLGMCYTHSPQESGTALALVNLVVDGADSSLRPRDGIRTDDVVLHSQGDTEGNPYEPDPKHIAASAETGEADGNTFLQVICGAKDLVLDADYDYWTGQLYAYTAPLESQDLVYVGGTGVSFQRPFSNILQHPERLPPEEELHPPIKGRSAFLRLLGEARFTRPEKYAIHGMRCVDTASMLRNVGAFWDNHYYWFGADNELYQTVVDADNWAYAQGAAEERSYLAGEPLTTFPPVVGTLPLDASGDVVYPAGAQKRVEDVFVGELVPDGAKRYFRVAGKLGSTLTLLPFTSSMNSLKTNPAGSKYIAKKVDKKEVTPNEAATVGYNMLLDKPYYFKCLVQGTSWITNGIVPYDLMGNVKTQPVTGEALVFRIFYDAPGSGLKYKYKLEWQPTGTSAWTVLKEGDVQGPDASAANIQPLSTPQFAAPLRAFTLRFTVWPYRDGAGAASATPYEISDHTFVASYNFDAAAPGSVADMEMRTYDIPKAKGMCYWSHRLVCWDVPSGEGKDDARTAVFASHIDDPSWFPFPGGVEFFDEPVMHCAPFLDDLLVFTKTKLWRLVVAEDGWGWNRSVIQQNLNISADDARLIRAIKQMLFFKSGDFFYLIVPKTLGGLAIAPISRPLTAFFSRFEESVRDLLSELYGYRAEGWPEHPKEGPPKLGLLSVDAFLDYDSVHVRYLFDTDWELLNMDMVYNTLTRAWTIEAFGSQSPVRQHVEDVTQRGTMISLFADADGKAGLQILRYDPVRLSDFHIMDGTSFTPSVIEEKYPDFRCIRAYEDFSSRWKNWQYLDTGYRAVSPDLFKRFREVQLRMVSHTSKGLRFSTEFLVDGMNRKPRYEFRTEIVGNEIVVYAEELPLSYLPGDTSLADGRLIGNMDHWNQGAGPPTEELCWWLLDKSGFAEQRLWKVRVKCGNGKGTAPRLKLVSRNEEPYSLLGYLFVYRAMGARGKYNGNL
jgi:hypothetical protein